MLLLLLPPLACRPGKPLQLLLLRLLHSTGRPGAHADRLLLLLLQLLLRRKCRRVLLQLAVLRRGLAWQQLGAQHPLRQWPAHHHITWGAAQR